MLVVTGQLSHEARLTFFEFSFLHHAKALSVKGISFKNLTQ